MNSNANKQRKAQKILIHTRLWKYIPIKRVIVPLYVFLLYHYEQMVINS